MRHNRQKYRARSVNGSRSSQFGPERFTGMQDVDLVMKPADDRWNEVQDTEYYGGNLTIDTDNLPDLAANPDPRAHEVLQALGRLGGLSDVPFTR